ncbi:MAG TPA: hypothetical protein VN654_15430 [Vicinamibacterales bacterium]|jgi:hypothetical protein|nr:hypothetical protein [Vicinamibacterales bacterium]
MIVRSHSRSAALGLAVLVVVTSGVAACGRKETPPAPMATPSLTLSHDKAPLGSPVDITYKFVVANDAHFTEDYRVLVHVVDADEELMFAFDHDPPKPTSQWKPGETIEYTKTVFIPIYPYVGEAAIHVGLHSTATQKRLPLAGENVGQNAYRVARLQLQPQTENVFTVYKEGWHPAEVAEHNSMVEWQWTKKDATLSFKNPKKDSLFYFEVDNPGSAFNEPQTVKVSLGGQAVDEFTLQPKKPELRKIPLKAAQLGSDDVSELTISVDKTYVPAVVASGSKDPRELGVRVFHAFVDPR